MCLNFVGFDTTLMGVPHCFLVEGLVEPNGAKGGLMLSGLDLQQSGQQTFGISHDVHRPILTWDSGLQREPLRQHSCVTRAPQGESGAPKGTPGTGSFSASTSTSSSRPAPDQYCRATSEA